MSPPLLVHVYPSYSVGGVQLRMALVMAHLGHRYRHLILSLDGPVDARSRLDHDLQVDVVGLGRMGNSVAEVARARRVLTAERPALLLTYNWGAIEWALAHTLFGQGAHIHLESGFGKEERDRQLWRRKMFRRAALRRANYLVVPSLGLAATAAQDWALAPSRVRRIANGCHLPPDPVTAKTSFGGIVIGTVAALRPEKNLGRLLRAVASLPATLVGRLVIAGDGTERAALEAEAARLGLDERVSFLGHVHHAERLMAEFDLFCLSSDAEQMPNVVLQAMAAGLAVAATSAGDTAAMVSAENRPFIVERDEAALARAIAELAAAPELRARLGAANRARVAREYTVESMVKAYEDLFEELAPTGGALTRRPASAA